MTLAGYLAQNGITQSAFAARVGVRTSTISRLCRGETRPEAGLVAAIARETAGAVMPNDLFPEADAALTATGPDRKVA